MEKMRSYPYYVTATDSFMSGWGLAEGKINKVVIGCDNRSEVAEVKNALRGRSDMKYVNDTTNPSRYSSSRYLISWYHYDANARFKFSR